MALTIDDIYDKEFKTKANGYDPDDVDQFLDEVCDEMTNMQDEIVRLQNQLAQAQADAAAARNAVQPAAETAPISRTSETLEGILLSAQRLADEAVENARAKADTMVNEAKDQAEQIVGEAQAEKVALSSEIESLRKSVVDYKAGFLTIINKYKDLVEKEDFLK